MFKAQESQISSIFDSGQYKQLIIPAFQRSYVWGTDEVENFWNDFISRNTDTNLHLVGSIIISKSDNDPHVFGVVDGQQRLITCSLFIAALRDVWGEIFGQDDGYYELCDYLVKRSIRSSELITKIKAPQDIRQSYEDLVVHKADLSSLLRTYNSKEIFNTYSIFKAKIEEQALHRSGLNEKQRKDILLNYLDNLLNTNCILVVLEDEADAYEVFEGFNARGVDLSIADLFKNLILSKIAGEPAKQELAIERWQEITQIIKDLGLPKFNINTFLRYCWITEHQYIGERELYKRIKKETTNYDQLLSDLHKTALSLKTLFSGDVSTVSMLFSVSRGQSGGELKYSSRIVASLQGLKAMNTQSYLVWVIALMKNEKRISPRWISKSLSEIEIFCFRYFGVSKQPANKIEKAFAKLARNLNNAAQNGKDHDLQTAVLNTWSNMVAQEKLLPSKEQFSIDFAQITLKQSNKIFIKYILTKIEQHLDTDEKNINPYSVNIEHILPQRPSKEWKVSKAELKNNVDRLGNLTIVLEKINSSIGNKPIKEKIDKMKESSLKINQDLINQVESSNCSWGALQIEERQQNLSVLADKVWNV